MELEFIDGLDAVSFTESGEKYQIYQSSGGGMVNFASGLMVPGRFGGTALAIVYTNGGELLNTKRLNLATERTIGIAIQPHNFSGFEGLQIWRRSLMLRFQIGNATQIAVQMRPDGRLELVRGTGINTTNPSDILDVCSNVLAVNSWYYLEVAVQFDTAGKIRVWLDGVQTFGDDNINTIPHGFGCDRVTPMRWQVGDVIGMYFDDIYVGRGIDALGPSRVITKLPNADFRAEWTPNSAVPHYTLVDDGPFGNMPDDDATYVQSPAADAREFFGFPEFPCNGRIWGMGLNLASKVTNLAHQVDPCFENDDASIISLGTTYQTPQSTSRYEILQGISEDSPNGQPWNPVTLRAAAWGARASATTRVSAVNLEALVSLDTEELFDCGAQSYSF